MADHLMSNEALVERLRAFAETLDYPDSEALLLEAAGALSRPTVGRETVQRAADATVLRVPEYDDRTSPEDWPEALLITSEELHAELLKFADALFPSTDLPMQGGGEP